VFPNYFEPPTPTPPAGLKRANGVFVIVAQNGDLYRLKRTMKELEDVFNSRFRYPYVFIGVSSFSSEFVENTKAMTQADCSYGTIPWSEWGYPSWADQKRARKAREEDMKDVADMGNEEFHFVSRYVAGFLHKHPLLEKYTYYFRVVPGASFPCLIDFDPFLFMQINRKSYGFGIAVPESQNTIPSLWRVVRSFVGQHPSIVPSRTVNEVLSRVSDDGGETYNLCHFWSNFEIASLDYLRSREYQEFFDYLDKTGGFFYERWSDAAVRSLITIILLKTEQIHFFRNVGFSLNPWTICPAEMAKDSRCICNPGKDVNQLPEFSCAEKFEKLFVKKTSMTSS